MSYCVLQDYWTRTLDFVIIVQRQQREWNVGKSNNIHYFRICSKSNINILFRGNIFTPFYRISSKGKVKTLYNWIIIEAVEIFVLINCRCCCCWKKRSENEKYNWKNAGARGKCNEIIYRSFTRFIPYLHIHIFGTLSLGLQHTQRYNGKSHQQQRAARFQSNRNE